MKKHSLMPLHRKFRYVAVGCLLSLISVGFNFFFFLTIRLTLVIYYDGYNENHFEP